MKLFTVGFEIYGSDGVQDISFKVLATDAHAAIYEALRKPESEKLLADGRSFRAHCSLEQSTVLSSEVPQPANVCAMSALKTEPDFAAIAKAVVETLRGLGVTL